MNLTISGHHLEITPALRDYISSKLERVHRRFDQVIGVRFLLALENTKEKEKRQSAECTIALKGGELHAKTSNADLYAAIDELIDKLDRQVVKFKDKLSEFEHTSHKDLPAAQA